MSRTGLDLQELRRSESAVVVEVAEIAGAGMSVSAASDAVFDALGRLVPFAGLSLSVPRTVTGQHRTIASRGYSRGLIEFLDNGYLRQDPGYHWMLRSGSRHFNWLSPDFDYSTTSSARNWFKPAGYSGGSTNHLRSRSSYLGELHVSTDDPRLPTIRALSVIDLLSPFISAIVNEFTIPQRIVEEEVAGTCGFLLTPDGTAVLPGRAPCPHIHCHDEIADLVRRRMPDSPSLAWSSHRWRWRDSEGWHVVAVVPSGDGHLLMHRREPLPHGITARELSVLTLVADGLTNRMIANHLAIAPKTVDRHVENLMGKLAALNRASLTRTACDEGLLLLAGPVMDD